MFKYAIAVAAVAASAGLAVKVSTPSADNVPQEPMTAGHKTAGHKTAGHNTARRPEKTVLFDVHGGDPPSSGDPIVAGVLGVLGVLDTVSVPKQLLGAAVGHVVRKLKSVDLTKLWKSAVFGALVTALGAAAAVAVAGLAFGVCAMLPHADKHPYDHGPDYPPTDFVLDPFGKYDRRH